MILKSLAVCIALTAAVSSLGGQTASARPARAASFTLCAPTNATEHQLRHSLVIVQRRIHHGFHFQQATVSLNGNCLDVILPHSIGWIRWLADDVAGQGHFGIGVAYPDAKKTLASGQIVRYKSDPVTSSNSNLPEVQVALGRPAFIGFSAKLVVRDGFDYVGVHLTPTGTRKLCHFTTRMTGKLAVVVLDHQVITDEQVSVAICGGKLLTGFPKTKSLDKPLGPRELIADFHSGNALPVPFTVTSFG